MTRRKRPLARAVARIALAGHAAALLLLATNPTRAQRLPAVEAEHYTRCMEAARRTPQAAFDDANAWRIAGGGHPAEHCADVALIGLGRYAEAAGKLEALADTMTKGPVELRAQVLDQAGQSWLLAGDPARAAGALSAALALTPNDADLLIDRAEALAGEKNFREAITDLDGALQLDAKRVDALVFRASAHRSLEQYDQARRDVDAALRLTPDQPDALLERGNIRSITGDEAGARKDWQRVVQVAPNSATEGAAKANLAKLDAAPADAAAPPAKPKPAPAKKK
ncbi:MAG TPA: tetratricopeptide repeat protein [Stellaceae bacterium]|nr:tetratricopeptide repeat protein [Stellaceae bacterium]